MIVSIAHNLVRWTQVLGGLNEDGDLRAKRFRYRYLNIPALLACSGRALVLKLRRDYPLFDQFVVALARLQSLPSPAT